MTTRSGLQTTPYDIKEQIYGHVRHHVVLASLGEHGPGSPEGQRKRKNTQLGALVNIKARIDKSHSIPLKEAVLFPEAEGTPYYFHHTRWMLLDASDLHAASWPDSTTNYHLGHDTFVLLDVIYDVDERPRVCGLLAFRQDQSARQVPSSLIGTSFSVLCRADADGVLANLFSDTKDRILKHTLASLKPRSGRQAGYPGNKTAQNEAGFPRLDNIAIYRDYYELFGRRKDGRFIFKVSGQGLKDGVSDFQSIERAFNSNAIDTGEQRIAYDFLVEKLAEKGLTISYAPEDLLPSESSPTYLVMTSDLSKEVSLKYFNGCAVAQFSKSEAGRLVRLGNEVLFTSGTTNMWSMQSMASGDAFNFTATVLQQSHASEDLSTTIKFALQRSHFDNESPLFDLTNSQRLRQAPSRCLTQYNAANNHRESAFCVCIFRLDISLGRQSAAGYNWDTAVALFQKIQGTHKQRAAARFLNPLGYLYLHNIESAMSALNIRFEPVQLSTNTFNNRLHPSCFIALGFCIEKQTATKLRMSLAGFIPPFHLDVNKLPIFSVSVFNRDPCSTPLLKYEEITEDFQSVKQFGKEFKARLASDNPLAAQRVIQRYQLGARQIYEHVFGHDRVAEQARILRHHLPFYTA